MFFVYFQHCPFYLRFWIADYFLYVLVSLCMYWSLKRVLNKLRKEFSQPVHEKADRRPAALNSSCSFLSQHFWPDCPNWCARATASFSFNFIMIKYCKFIV